jgi:hypothetical protein
VLLEKRRLLTRECGSSRATRGELVAKLDSVKDSAVRVAMVEAIAHLAPRGDVVAAERLEKIVAAEMQAGAIDAGDDVFKEVRAFAAARATNPRSWDT